MHLPLVPLVPLVLLSPFVAEAFVLPWRQHVFKNPTFASPVQTSYIPTIHESAVLARRILHLQSIGTLSTRFPAADHQADALPSYYGRRPQDVAGAPIGLIDYFADCEPHSGNPTLLAVSIATSFRNEAAGSNISLSVRWEPAYRHPYAALSMPRYSLIGYLEDIPAAELQQHDIEGCFTGYHPDAVTWFPGNGIHESKWVRMVVREVFWIGGFGDRAYIGWIPLDDWKNVTREEIEHVRLPGEKRRGGWFSSAR